MVSPITERLVEALEKLSPAQQASVLTYAQRLASDAPPAGQPGSSYLTFAGLIPPEDLDEMSRAIAQGCETIRPDEW